jgi:hypothetical protein
MCCSCSTCLSQNRPRRIGRSRPRQGLCRATHWAVSACFAYSGSYEMFCGRCERRGGGAPDPTNREMIGCRVPADQGQFLLRQRIRTLLPPVQASFAPVDSICEYIAREERMAMTIIIPGNSRHREPHNCSCSVPRLLAGRLATQPDRDLVFDPGGPVAERALRLSVAERVAHIDHRLQRRRLPLCLARSAVHQKKPQAMFRGLVFWVLVLKAGPFSLRP